MKAQNFEIWQEEMRRMYASLNGKSNLFRYESNNEDLNPDSGSGEPEPVRLFEIWGDAECTKKPIETAIKFKDSKFYNSNLLRNGITEDTLVNDTVYLKINEDLWFDSSFYIGINSDGSVNGMCSKNDNDGNCSVL